MKMNRLVLIFCVLVGGVLSAAGKQPYSRYEPIVTRAPFGRPPANFNPTVNPSTVSARSGANGEKELTPEQEQLKKAVKFSAINLDPEGTLRVGFSDMSSAKMPRHYYLAIGETRDGWTVLEANAFERTAKLEKDGVELEMCLGSDVATGTANAATTPAPHSAAAPKAAADDKLSNRLLGRRGILAQRKEREEKQKAEREARAKQEEENRAQIREELATLRENLRQVREEREKEKEKAEEAAALTPATAEEPPPPPPPEEGVDLESAE